MEIAKQISTGDFLIKGNETEMELFKELFDKNQEMTKQIAKREERQRISKLLEGIDKTEIESNIGWWETSTGAEFGKKILDSINKVDISKNKISKK